MAVSGYSYSFLGFIFPFTLWEREWMPRGVSAKFFNALSSQFLDYLFHLLHFSFFEKTFFAPAPPPWGHRVVANESVLWDQFPNRSVRQQKWERKQRFVFKGSLFELGTVFWIDDSIFLILNLTQKMPLKFDLGKPSMDEDILLSHCFLDLFFYWTYYTDVIFKRSIFFL